MKEATLPLIDALPKSRKGRIKRKALAAFTVGAGLKHLSSRDDHLFLFECVARMPITTIL
jgi:hypothetical protein